MFTREKVTRFGVPAVKEEIVSVDGVDGRQKIFRHQRERPVHERGFEADELKAAGRNVSRIDEERHVGVGRADSRFGLSAESHLVVIGSAKAVADSQMGVLSAFALTPRQISDSPRRCVFKVVAHVVAEDVAVGPEEADGPRSAFFKVRVVGHHSHVAGGGESLVGQRTLHERRKAVRCITLEAERLEEVTDANSAQVGHVVQPRPDVEKARPAAQGEVHLDAILGRTVIAEDAESRAAERLAVLNIAEPRPVRLVLIERVEVGL